MHIRCELERAHLCPKTLNYLLKLMPPSGLKGNDLACDSEECRVRDYWAVSEHRNEMEKNRKAKQIKNVVS